MVGYVEPNRVFSRNSGLPVSAAEQESISGQPPPGAADDQALLAQASRGDTAALGVLYDRYGRLVFSVALRVIGDRQSAEEITQDTFLRLWQQAARYAPERGSFTAWLLTIAHHRAIDELRGRRGSARRREVLLPEVLPDRHNHDPADLSQLRTDLQSALAELPQAQREAIELAFFGGMSRQEIARQAACPLPTVHTRLRLGMEKLRAILLRGEQSDQRREGRDEP
jgi:RNA polymerase sigma-70 factor, ECF subfamily